MVGSSFLQTERWWNRMQTRSSPELTSVMWLSLWWETHWGRGEELSHLPSCSQLIPTSLLLLPPSLPPSLSATTHTDLILRAVECSIPYKVIHNASILNAIGCCGLQLYHFGETVSIPFWTETWKPDSFLDKIEGNLERGLHTLCLLGRELCVCECPLN